MNATDSANYRGIALISILGKLFDNIILVINSDKLTTSDTLLPELKLSILISFDENCFQSAIYDTTIITGKN